jgi:hypothetical protein
MYRFRTAKAFRRALSKLSPEFAEASSIGFKRSVKYGLGVLRTSLKFRIQKMGLAKFSFSIRREPGCFMRIIMSCATSFRWRVVPAIVC